ncbi:MAG: 1,4-alpha-glucan branching protein domain-containing protein [Candidatus Eisenbacteria bacterium]
MSAGSFTFVLHSHLPWVLHHGRWPHGVDWLNEAAAETYLPLWRVLHERTEDGRSLGVTLGLTPVLCEQLAHPDFQRQFVAYLEQKIAAAAEDRAWFTRSGEPALAALAARWERFYRASLEEFMGPHGPNLVARFRRLEERGAIEIITCGATHGYLPLLSSDAAAAGQLRTAVTAHRRHFGRAPRGVWLPECAYRPAGPWRAPEGSSAPASERRGVEELLSARGLRYFFVDTHLLSGGKPLGVYADRFEALHHIVRDGAGESTRPGQLPYRPYRVGSAGQVACFGRDPVTAMQVWSGQHGYPGDGAYLDFHKKRFPGGHRYWSVTHPQADLAHKQVYRPGAAEARVPEHAAHFFTLLERTLRDASHRQGTPPIVCAMFDTELFGHWWFEGPRFVGEVLDLCAKAGGVSAIPAGEMLERQPPQEMVALPEGSWGDGGGHQVWLNDATRWTWPLVHGAEGRFESLATTAAARESSGRAEPLLERLLNQAGRELLLLESSDWQFLITTFSARDYAELRVTEHAEAFERLATLAERRAQGGSLSEADENFLADCERRDSLFPDFDWRGYAGSPAPAQIGAR